jgi:hypothetical protein
MLNIVGQGGNSQVTLFGQTQNSILVQASPPGLDFGATGVGGSQTLPLTLTNSAGSPFALSGITFSLPDYTETDNCQGQIPVGSACTVNVKFTPQQMALRRGAATVAVSISSLTTNVPISGVGVTPFVLQAAPGQSLSMSVRSGATAIYQLQGVAAAGVSDTVQLSCSNLPQYATCSFQPASLALTSGGTSGFAVNVATGPASSAKQLGAQDPLLAALLFVSLLSLRSRNARACVILVGLGCVLALTGCGGGSSGSVAPPAPSTTSPGTYAIAVTGTSGSLSQPITLALTVN